MPITDNRSTSGSGGAVSSVNGQVGAVNITPASIGLGSVANENHEVYPYVLLAADITAKQITLPGTPSIPAQVSLEIRDGGISQEYGVDFTVAGNVLSWGTLGFENIAEAGDALIIRYQI
jgi:hypothetical protein